VQYELVKDSLEETHSSWSSRQSSCLTGWGHLDGSRRNEAHVLNIM